MRETFQKLWAFSANRHKALGRALGFSFLRSVFGLTELLAILRAVRVLLGQAEVRDSVVQIAILTLICVLGNFFTSYIEQTSTLETGFFMIGDKRVSIGGLLRRVPLGFFSETSNGKLIATLTTTLSGVETAATMVLVGIISGLFSAVTLFLFMLVYDWRTGLLSGAGMAAYLLVVGWQMKVSRRNAPALQTAQRNLAEAALSFLQGVKVTKAFSFRSGDRRLQETVRNSCDENLALTSVSMPSQFAAGLTVAVFESAILLLSLYRRFALGELDTVQTVVLLLFSFLVYASLNQAGSMLSMIGLLDAGLDEAVAIEATEQLEERQPVETAADHEIRFHDVSFAYGDNEVLHHVTATIPANACTAIIGPSGSGKTTLCQLIPRFRDVTAGSITIGGADVRHMKSEDLMARISMVFQHVYLFEDTILNNIRFGRPDATEEEVRAAARAARCDDFIMALPDGYNTVVEEGGSSLSGGEKQRISIARAMLKDAPIIILDESTSALDAENEHDVLAALEALTRDKTVIMIAHRIQSVQRADQILALDHGRIVQAGTHEELAGQRGLYADFLASRREVAGWQLTR